MRLRSGFEKGQAKSKSKACVQLSESIRMFPKKKISTHGEIYKGEEELQSNDTRPIVLKLVENISCGETEARILANLNYHKHVLSHIHHGTCHFKLVDQIYIALDKCHRENLRDFVTNRKKDGFAFNFSQANVIVKQMVDGVKHIHKNRIIHKDIKPDNILFSLDQKLIKIADFGLSREIDSSSAEVFEERQFGTDGFRPPESFGNGIISQKSDIFSLGVTFYFVLSNGEHPFGEDRAVWNHRMMNGEVDLSRLLDIPNKISAEHLIKSMIAHKINHRPTIWQVSEHPFWTGNEVSCDIDYHCPESAVSLIPQTSEEPSYNSADVYQHLEHLQNIQRREKAEAAYIRWKETPQEHHPVIADATAFPTNVEVIGSTEHAYNAHLHDEKIYHIDPRRRKGRALIINNDFQGTNDFRSGSKIDVRNMRVLWISLGFDVVIKTNLTAQQMRDSCRTFAAESFNISVVVVIIMTHGEEDHDGKECFLGQDKEMLAVEDVIATFTSNVSPQLRGIPKLFLFQAWRGGGVGFHMDAVDTRGFGERYLPLRWDMLITYPTQAGYVAFRNSIHGSWLMNAVTNVFMQHAHDTHVLDMLIMVNNAVSRRITSNREIQISNQVNYLKKKLFLYPGWPVTPAPELLL